MSSSKRVKIRAPTQSLCSHDLDLDSSWPVLDSAIDTIYEEKQSAISFEIHYRIVYSLVIRKYGEQLLGKVKQKLRERMEMLYCTRFEVDLGSMEFLKQVDETWNHQRSCLKMVSDLMLYMDRDLSWRSIETNVYDLGMELFRDIVVKPITDKLVDSIIEEINRARKSLDCIDTIMVARVTNMMKVLSEQRETLYKLYFEPSLLKDVRRYYSEWRQGFDSNALEYIQEVKDLLNHELCVYEHITGGESATKAHKLMKIVLISENINFVLEHSVHDCFKRGDEDNLALIIDLCKDPEDQQHLLDVLSRSVVEDVMKTREDSSGKKKTESSLMWVKGLVKVKEDYSRIFQKPEFNHGPFLKTVTDALAKVINEQPQRAVECISTTIDSFLRTNVTLGKEFQSLMQDCISLFVLMRDKDLFELYYKQQLSKRLIQKRSSLPLEHWIISKMTHKVGIDFTAKLEGMFRDINVSLDYDRKFKASHDDIDIDYQVEVLTPTFWPFQSIETSIQDIVLPQELDELRVAYENFYLGNHSGRTLKWAGHLGFMELGFHFNTTYHELSMSVYAAVILLLFNNYSELSMQDIQDLTHIPEQELLRQLVSLATAPRSRILKKNPPTKTVKSTDKFSINYDFTAPTTKVKVTTVILKNDPTSSQGGLKPAANKSLEKELEHDRIQVLSAAIVRIMKSEKKLLNKELYEKVSRSATNVNFEITNQLFDKSISNLIEKEYMQKNPEDPMMFHYL
ncbi:HDL470Cp [Eremothecium sinecaudum]|uniref:HDL470Cp n=1 Tax=Eremothecium sinecaudum TaxID=45286 RepID=A0A0X8HRT3_9SACH|nr:HDL470Cp [Eremothecium sinecaudum]AMD20274.1 HDL470Cp [Eremothecium sinecaudum]